MLSIEEIIKDLILSYIEQYNEIQKRIKELSSTVSVIDQKLTDIDHYITFHKLPANKLAKLIKARKELLIERRPIKNELTDLNNCKAYLGSVKKLQEHIDAKPKTYTYRTKVISEILG